MPHYTCNLGSISLTVLDFDLRLTLLFSVMTQDPLCKKRGWHAVCTRTTAKRSACIDVRVRISVCHHLHVRENCSKEWGGFRTWSALLPMGWGDKCVCVRESVCVHLWQQTFIVQRGPLPWLQGFIALKNTDHTEHLVTVTSHWQSCRLKQTDTQNGVMMMKEDVRQTGSNAQLCASQASVLVFTGLFSPRVIRNSFTPNS